jgi:hypothetical protein
MPSPGSYWYGRAGSPSVVRVIEESAMLCTHLALNSALSLPYYQRIRPMHRSEFLSEYQSTPDVSDEWLQPGTRWYDRENSERVLEIFSGRSRPDPSRRRDRQIETIVVQFPHSPVPGYDTRVSYSVAELTARYIRIDAQPAEATARFWVMGAGMRVPFSTEFQARAFIYDTTAALGLHGRALRVYRRPLDYRPATVAAPPTIMAWNPDNDEVDSVLREAVNWTPMILPGENYAVLNVPELDFDGPWLNQNGDLQTRELRDRAFQAFRDTLPQAPVTSVRIGPTKVEVTPTSAPEEPSLWDHLMSDEQEP